jgi:cytochrome c oxidase subunit I+III
VTAIDVRSPQARRRVDRLERVWAEPGGVTGWLTTTDHKRIGLMYLAASLTFFAAGGAEALTMRTQLAQPNERVLSPETYNQFLTMHGVTMIFFFVIPLSIGFFGNYLVPLMIGARDMAFPRLNALSFWLFLASGLFIYTSVFIHKAPNQGWFSYVPLAGRTYDPGPNVDFYNLGLILNSVSSTAAAANFVVTMVRHRAPGMSLNRMPLFCWALLATSFSLLFALPSLTLANVLLELDRKAGFHFFDAARGGDPLLWQHLFWFFGHPEVYIIVLPAFGIATSIIPTFTRRRMVAYPLVALAEVMVAFIGFGVWVHHMFSTGLPDSTLLYFAAASLVIVIPSGIQIFAWCMTLVTGRPEFRTPLLFIVGFIVFFVFGGLSGITFAAIPVDQQLTDTYYVVAHFHYVIWGAAVFPVLGGLYYWWPKVTGRMYHERAGQISFWLVFAGTNLTFFPMHIQGIGGMPRRVYTYPAGLGWGTLNLIETVGGFVIAAGLLLQLANLLWTIKHGRPVGANPWRAPTLEWRTTSPPPAYNFAVIPKVSSAYPAWDDDDVELDGHRLERGELVLDGGHETPATTLQDGWLDEVVEMPAGSAVPVVLALFACLAAVLVLLSHYYAAAGSLVLVLLTLAVWHAKEPVDA